MITFDKLKLIIPKCPQDRGEALIEVMPQFNIHTPARMAAFIAQVAHESVELTRIEENLNYSAEGLRKIFKKYFPDDEIAKQYARQPEKIANHVYCNRMNNGDEASGDGWKYRGRGFIQLTGKSNYEKAKKALGIDFVNNPELVLLPINAAKTSAHFWQSNGLNDLADTENFLAITKKINGGTLGIEERKHYWEKAKSVLT